MTSICSQDHGLGLARRRDSIISRSTSSPQTTVTCTGSGDELVTGDCRFQVGGGCSASSSGSRASSAHSGRSECETELLPTALSKTWSARRAKSQQTGRIPQLLDTATRCTSGDRSTIDTGADDAWSSLPQFEGDSPKWWKLRFKDRGLEEQYLRSKRSTRKRLFQCACWFVLIINLAWMVFFLAQSSIHTGLTKIAGPVSAACIAAAMLGASIYARRLGTFVVCKHVYNHEQALLFVVAVVFAAAGIIIHIISERSITMVARFGVAVIMLTILYTGMPLPMHRAVVLAVLYSISSLAVDQVSNGGWPKSGRSVLFVCLKVLLHLAAHTTLLHVSYMFELFQRNAFWQIGLSLLYEHDLDFELALQEQIIHSVMPAVVAGRIINPDESEQQDQVQFRPLKLHRMDNVSILFADIVGFTQMSSNKTASRLVALLNDLFGRFDVLTETHGCEKISTLGDCYYCVAGCPEPCRDHADRCVAMGLSMLQSIEEFCADNGESISMRVGIHTGTVLCGIVGSHRFKFDVFSNDVRLANQLESGGVPGKVHISEATHKCLVYPERFDIIEGNGGSRNEALEGLSTYLVVGRMDQEQTTSSVSAGQRCEEESSLLRTVNRAAVPTRELSTAAELQFREDSASDIPLSSRELDMIYVQRRMSVHHRQLSVKDKTKFDCRPSILPNNCMELKRTSSTHSAFKGFHLQGFGHESPVAHLQSLSKCTTCPHLNASVSFARLDLSSTPTQERSGSLQTRSFPLTSAARADVFPVTNSLSSSSTESKPSGGAVSRNLSECVGSAWHAASHESVRCDQEREPAHSCDPRSLKLRDAGEQVTHPPADDDAAPTNDTAKNEPGDDKVQIKRMTALFGQQEEISVQNYSGGATHPFFLTFCEAQLEECYRRQFTQDRSATQGSPISSPKFSLLVQTVINLVFYLLTSGPLFAVFSRVHTCWILTFMLGLVVHGFNTLAAAVVTYSHKVSSGAVRLFAWVTKWWVMNAMAMVSLTFPIAFTFPNLYIHCSLSEVISYDDHIFLLFVLQLSVAHCLSYTQLHSWLKVVCALLLGGTMFYQTMAACTIEVRQCEGQVVDSLVNATIADCQSDGYVPSCDDRPCLLHTLPKCVRDEVILDSFLLLLVLIVLNREYETMARLNFKSSLFARLQYLDIHELKENADALLNNLLPKHVCLQLKVGMFVRECVCLCLCTHDNIRTYGSMCMHEQVLVNNHYLMIAINRERIWLLAIAFLFFFIAVLCL